MRIVTRTVLLILVLTLVFALVSSVFVSASIPTPNSIVENAIDTDAEEGLGKLTGMLLRYIQIIGAIAAVLILAIYGIQWFLASPQQKAILKEKAWAYVIGAVLVFGGATVMVWIAKTFSGAFNT